MDANPALVARGTATSATITAGAPAAASDRPAVIQHLNQQDLARRWKLSARTLERWRWSKVGPRYVKVGGHVVYRLNDIETFEAERARG